MAKATTTLLVTISVASQILAATSVIQALGTAELPLAIPAWQALSALSAAAAFSQAMPLDTPSSRALAFSHCFVMSLFMPVVGQALFLALAHYAHRASPPQGANPVRTQGFPRFDPELLSRITYGPPHPDTPAHAATAVGKARALMTSQGASLDGTGRSLDQWLEHNDEEIRLMAFGIWTLGENAVVDAINRTTAELNDASADTDKARLHGNLAQLHWQLLERGLVQPEMERLVIEACEKHAKEALTRQPGHAQAWFVLGSCALRTGRAQQAFTYLGQAREHHFPEVLVLPGLAKAAFHQRDYRRVRQTLRPLQRGVPPLSHKGILEYWKP